MPAKQNPETRPSPAPRQAQGEQDEEACPAPLPLAGEAGGGPETEVEEAHPLRDVCPPLTSPASGRGNRLTAKSARPNRRTSATAFESDPPDADDPLLGFAPFVHAAARRNSITPERQRAFIAALAATGIVTQAARSIGASLEALYRLRNRKGAEGFAEAWEQALDRGIARLEDCALERAILGEERMVLRGGEVVASWRRYDTQLLMFLLRQRRARRWNVAGTHFANLKPGHPVYERLKRDWTREEAIRSAARSHEIVESINRKLERMRQRMIASGELSPDED